MKKRLLIWTCLAWAPVAAAAGDAQKQCCFTNVAYAGVCQVAPAEGETCDSILSYLNTPNSGGKSYCNSTPTRGGWQETTCEATPKAGTAEGRRSPAGRPASPAPAEPLKAR